MILNVLYLFTKDRGVFLSLLKYPGGKESELQYIVPNLPMSINNYYEPFVGGGSVYFCSSIKAERYFINDKSKELINLYQCVKEKKDSFFKTLNEINICWIELGNWVKNNAECLISTYLSYRNNDIDNVKLSEFITTYLINNSAVICMLFADSFYFDKEKVMDEIKTNFLRKAKRMKHLESKSKLLTESDILDNIECSFKSAFYMNFRYIFNHFDEMNVDEGFQAAVYLFIRDMCYSSMFRYNANGEFNVPYGGISYNKKSFKTRIEQYKDHSTLNRLEKTVIGCGDFYDFMEKYPIKKGDFIFLDPPYDTEFSEYAKNEFNKKDQIRLANYLLNECVGNFMLVIKNTDFISSLYPENKLCANGNKLSVCSFDKRYMVSFKNRNNKEVKHLMITNY